MGLPVSCLGTCHLAGQQVPQKEEFAQAVSDLRQSVGVVGSLKEYGIDQKEWEAKLDTLTENAMKDPCTLFNPRKPKFEEIKAILQACYEGTVVDF